MAAPADGIAVAGGGEGQEQPQLQQKRIAQTIAEIIGVAMFCFFISRFFRKATNSSEPGIQIKNLFEKGELLDMWFYMSEHENFSDFANEKSLVWQETNIPYAIKGPESTRNLSLKWYPSQELKYNGSLYAHVYFARSGYSPDPNNPKYEPWAAFGKTCPVVTYMPKSNFDKRSGDVETVSEVEAASELESKDVPVEWASYWRPNITINLVDDVLSSSLNAIPPNIAPYLNIEATTSNYFPIIYFKEFWLLKEKLILINETVTELPLNLEVGPISAAQWQLYLRVDGESDALKRVLLVMDRNPYVVLVLMIIPFFHSLFGFQAYKKDIQFWNSRRSMKGLSAMSVVMNFLSQLIVFLYLLDNDTPWETLAPSGVGCCIEFWKIGKAVRVKIDTSRTIPMLRFRHRHSYKHNMTKEYDDIAMKYLSYLIPFLVVCSSIYSLMYEHHTSWYSWILSSITQCVYKFGFILMFPQLFINYKMKSVAHMPWDQMSYKFLNSIGGHIFVFAVKLTRLQLHMPSVFHVDFMFLVFLYQSWIYPVHRNRVNELGVGGEEAIEAIEAIEAFEAVQAFEATGAVQAIEAIEAIGDIEANEAIEDKEDDKKTN